MGIFFAILSPALYSVVNYVDKFLLEKYHIHPTVIALYSGSVAAVASLGILFFTGFHLFSLMTSLILITSGFLTMLTLIPYFKALSLDETSRVIPLFQMVPLFVLVLSFIFLQEVMTMKQYIGSFCIIFAAFLLSVEKVDAKIFRLRKAFFYMVIASLLSAISLILFKVGVGEIDFWHTLPYEGLGIVLGSLAIISYKDNISTLLEQTKKLPKKLFLFISLNEVIFVSSRYTAFFALSLIPASLVSVLSGFQPFFVLCLGVLLSLFIPHLIKELLSKETIFLKIVASIIILIGIYLIS